MKKQLLQMHKIALAFEAEGNVEAGNIITQTMAKISGITGDIEPWGPAFQDANPSRWGKRSEPRTYDLSRLSNPFDLEQGEGDPREDIEFDKTTRNWEKDYGYDPTEDINAYLGEDDREDIDPNPSWMRQMRQDSLGFEADDFARFLEQQREDREQAENAEESSIYDLGDRLYPERRRDRSEAAYHRMDRGGKYDRRPDEYKDPRVRGRGSSERW